MTLTDFLLARIAEREAVARAATPGPWRSESGYEDAGAIYTDAPLDSLPLKDDTWTEDHQRNIANESAWGDIRIQDAAHIALNDPAYVLADCEAKRRIIAEHLPTATQRTSEGYECRTCLSPAYRYDWPNLWTTQPWPCTTLCLLASLDANHPDYDEDWKP